MWTLQHKSKDQILYIGGAKEHYNIGRSACDIILSNDTSISRKHASLQHSGTVLKVIDHNSRYGTFINDHIDKIEKIAPNEVWPLNLNDRIKFGRLENEFNVGKLELHTVCSTVTPPEKEMIARCLAEMSGSMEQEFSSRVTHLTMPQITVTLKLIECLVAGVPVVTPAFWEKCLEAVKSNTPLPDPAVFVPALIDEGILVEDAVSFQPNAGRKSLFSGKTFYFLSKKYADRFEAIIKAAGGKCFSLDRKKVQKSLLVKAGAIVVQRSTGFSQESQLSQALDAVADYVRSKGKRMIPESEIGLAILHCSARRHCNPDYDFPTAFGAAALCKPIKSDLLVKNTMEDVDMMLGSMPSHPVEVPESQSGTPAASIDYEAPASVTIHDSSEEEAAPVAHTSTKRRQSVRSTQLSKKIALEIPPTPTPEPAQTVKNSTSFDEPPQPVKPKLIEIADSDSEPDLAFERSRPQRKEPAKQAPSVAAPAVSPVAPKRVIINSSDDDDADKGNRDSDEEPGSLFGFEKRSKTKKAPPKSPVEKYELPTMVETLTLTSQPPSIKKPLPKPIGPPLYKPKALQRLFSPDIKAINISSIGWLETSLDQSVTIPETPSSIVDEVDIKQEPIDEYCLSIDELTQMWLKSLKNAFRINSKIVKLEGKSGSLLCSTTNGSSVAAATPSLVSSGRPNYKAFVKAQNYIPQVEIVACRKFVVRKDDEDVD